MSAAETNLLLQTNDINCNNNNQKVSATNSDQINNDKTKLVINVSTSNSDNESANGGTNDKNSQPPKKNSTNRICQPPLVDDINNPNATEIITITSSNGIAAAATLSRTLTRNSCSNMNGQSVAKSWYARCNRWRSQSCDRRKNTAIRYSWNMIGNRPV